ncbi:hypothetical protein MM236_05470 [Belliella sp. DSM 107340]|uniref:Uncharacterized protein n=1 Tax=Belliella calami TaxID=2923436 RepID=A0ABS9ULW6_9BACT|nr:hypothetical protein [Belliella calami]MCH7397425.1 hypothetical protein [Belliella calami]
MKKQYILFTTTFLVLIMQSAFGQKDPYDAINMQLEKPVDAKLLWPWENDLLKDANVTEFSAYYKLIFDEKDNSELVIDFKNFEKLVSATYLKNQVSGKFLAELLRESVSDNYIPVFEKFDGEEIFYMFSNGSIEQEEVYFLATGKENYELLYFKYKPKTKEKDRLKFQLQNTLNK